MLNYSQWINLILAVYHTVEFMMMMMICRGTWLAINTE